MCSLIPAFRLLLCSGASRCGGVFSFLWRLVTQFLCVTTLGLALLPATAISASNQHTITFDHYSLMIDGKRVFIYSGEFHPFRLPSPALWLDVFQKMKAGGFNTICCYFDWDYHSAKSGTYDFTGIRDLDRFLSLASEAGLYVIVRPGPYINAETDSGGFPGWLTTIQGRARSTAPDYLAAAYQWLSQVDPIYRSSPANEWNRDHHRLPGRERVLRQLVGRPAVHAKSRKKNESGRYPGTADREPQCDIYDRVRRNGHCRVRHLSARI
jgi:beta-galactosidase GanA